MKKILLVFCVAILFIACGGDKKGSMLVNGEVKGLKKGTLYLKKLKDTAFVAVDSVKLDGIGTFSLADELESPEIYHLNLNNDPKKTILFFGDTGTITIKTPLDKFNYRADIKGLKNQELLDEFSEMAQKFNSRRLDLIKAEFEFQKDSFKHDSIIKLANNLVKTRYLYTTQFAVRNADNVIAPYIALTELNNANVKLLDTVNNSLSSKVKATKYGKKLQEFINKVKAK